MKAKKAGYKIIQVKINGDPVEAAEKIAEARSLLDQNETLLIDANTGRFKSLFTLSIDVDTTYPQWSFP